MRKASFITLLLILITATLTKAQTPEPEMADVLRANGKLYVVVAVLTTILVGTIIYLIRIDRKITKLEKK